jgi:hypothetical protein
MISASFKGCDIRNKLRFSFVPGQSIEVYIFEQKR